MSLWEYKIISSGRGGFATPAMLEKFLNDLGRDEWEIIDFRSPPDNPLAFTGLARRSTQRDWTLEDAAAAAAKAEAEKLRAEFSAKFQAATASAQAVEEKSPSFIEEKAAPDGGFRKPVDTSRDSDPDAQDDESAEKDEWDQLAQEDELPSFFDALKPHMRRNQRGPGMSVGTDYLAKKWGLAEEDIKGALVECGMQIPADENAKPTYIEYDGDLFWVNINRRGEVWINTREKPRPVFRVVQGTKVAADTIEESKPEPAKRSEEAADRPERVERQDSRKQEPSDRRPGNDVAPKAEPAVFQPSPKKNGAPAPVGSTPLPSGSGLLEKIRPHMRRNRRGPGGSGSTTFLARALKCTEADLVSGFEALSLVVPPTAADQPVEREISGDIWWLNKDSRGGLWINGREKEPGEVAGAPGTPATTAADASTEVSTATATDVVAPVAAEPAELLPTLPIQSVATDPASAPTSADNVLAAVRLLLKVTKTGSFAGKVDRVAEELSKTPEELTAALVNAGMKLPEKPREKPVFVEHAGEIFWVNRNAKGELWVNAKASKYADASDSSEAEASDGSDEGKKSARRPAASRAKKAPEQSS
ncbi:MAG: hypothetical protein ABIZ04_17465 [Opitutus sp.]